MLKAFSVVFATIFLAEIGDKTQLATLLFASDGSKSRWVVFLAASAALVAAAGVGVLAGGLLEKLLPPELLHRIAGTGFLLIGVWMLLRP